MTELLMDWVFWMWERGCLGRFSEDSLAAGGWWPFHQRDAEGGADLEGKGIGGEASRKGKGNFRSEYVSVMYQQDPLARNGSGPGVRWIRSSTGDGHMGAPGCLVKRWCLGVDEWPYSDNPTRRSHVLLHFSLSRGILNCFYYFFPRAFLS